MQLDTEKILVSKDDGIGWLTFNNPARRNAMSLEMWDAVSIALDDFAADSSVRVVVLKGAGGKSFVSGADISQFEKHRSDAAAEEVYAQSSKAARDKMAALRKPIIAMIQGFCVGGGVGVAMKADIRIASEDSQFGIPAARLGIAYSLEGLHDLLALVGPARAKEMLFTGRRYSAAEALAFGLVNKVVPPAQLEEAVAEYTGEIKANAPLTIAASKVIVNEAIKDLPERNHALVSEVYKACFDSSDFAEGRRAFMEKRKPVFRGQ
jgi:enoyl-CoA hydratase/carnithine racemase